MNISVCVATYGDQLWQTIADRAIISTGRQGAHEVIANHDPSGTVSSSRNAAAERATGDWLLFVDADDELERGYLDAMKASYTGDDHVLLTPSVRTLRKGISPKSKPVFFDRGLSLRQDNWLIVGTLIHKDLFFDVGGFGEYPHGFEDWSLWSKAWRAGAEIVKVPDAVYVYHWNPQSKHKQGWRDRKWQVETHNRVAAELDAWEAART